MTIDYLIDVQSAVIADDSIDLVVIGKRIYMPVPFIKKGIEIKCEGCDAMTVCNRTLTNFNRSINFYLCDAYSIFRYDRRYISSQPIHFIRLNISPYLASVFINRCKNDKIRNLGFEYDKIRSFIQ